MRIIAVFCMVVIALSATPSAQAGEEMIIPPGTEHIGDVRLENASLRVESGAKLNGNIFIEEGDLFIAEEGYVSAGGGSVSIKIKKGNIWISGGKVQGNIFIEEGDLFIAEEDAVLAGGGAVSIKKGNIFIKNAVEITATITVELGNVTMKDKNKIKGDVICKKGVVELGANNLITGDVYAVDLDKGPGSKIVGTFIKTN